MKLLYDGPEPWWFHGQNFGDPPVEGRSCMGPIDARLLLFLASDHVANHAAGMVS